MSLHTEDSSSCSLRSSKTSLNQIELLELVTPVAKMESDDASPLLNNDDLSGDSPIDSGVESGSNTPEKESNLSVDDLGAQFENLLCRIGGFGRYQKCVIFLIIFPMFFASSFMASALLFVTADPAEHWCKIPGLNLSGEEEKTLLPLRESLHKGQRKKVAECKMYAINYSEIFDEYGGLSGLISYINKSRDHLNITECTDGWHYEGGTLENNIIMEFNLVCALAFLPTLVYLMSSVGGVLGIPIGGFFADKFGRKNTYFWFLLVFVALGIGSCFAPTLLIFAILVSLQNVGGNPGYILPYMIGIEILEPEMRSTFSVIITVAFTLGGVAFTGVAYWVRNWRHMLLYSTAPFALFFVYWFVTPESPRWLLSVGRYGRVERFLRKVAKRNGREFDSVCEEKFRTLQETYENLGTGKTSSKQSWWNLLKSPNLRRKTLLLTYLSCAVNIIYNGLNYYAPALGTDPYLNFLLVGLVELPSSLLTQLVADRLGRRLTMVMCFAIGSAACIGSVVLPVTFDDSSTQLVLFLTVKLFITSAYTVQELIVYELLPTNLRGEGVAMTNIIGYLISNFGPVIVYLRFSHAQFPMLMFGSFMIGGILCTMVLPETLNCPLPETVAEAENFGKDLTLKKMMRLWPWPKRSLVINSATSELTESGPT